MDQSKDVTTCFYAFSDIANSLEIFKEIFNMIVCLLLDSYADAHLLILHCPFLFLPNCTYV